MTRRNSPIEGSSRRRWRDRLAVALIGLICGATVALGDEARDSTTVTFPSAWTIDATQISAELFVPAGAGPFPALVLLHGSSGIGEENYIWAARFRSMGYVALVVDSLGSRGIEKHPKQPYVHLQFGDAYGALAYLQRQPFADENRIGVIGWSHGGYAVLHAARVNGRISRIFARRVGRFSAAVALYPYCGGTDVFDIPILILIGEADDWSPASMCVTLARAAAQMGSPLAVDVVVYPEAAHGFDSEVTDDPAQVAA